MSKQKGKGTSPVKHVPQARPLLVGELLTICNMDTAVAGRLLNRGFRKWKRGKKGFAKDILWMILKDEKDVNGMRPEKAFRQIDENRATRILRAVAKRMAARQVQQT